ncbi:MAG TPA: aminodeoxychorismate synthase component I [Saprospiraceae bacterium]|nr:aminodeoxychorismate synthase component I [Saprospiraceae bacterium]
MDLIQEYQDIIQQMNQLYAAGSPFVFVIDFAKSKGICRQTRMLDPMLMQLSMDSQKPARFPGSIAFEAQNADYDAYRVKFQAIQDQLSIGNTFLCNLTQPTRIQTNLNLWEIFHYSDAPYKLFLKDRFVVFSPEPFVTIEEGHIQTFPMKGTLSAMIPDSHRILAEDPKENAEHNTIVDLMRNDLSMVADSVRVERLKYLTLVNTHKGPIWQMSSAIRGKIKAAYLHRPGALFDRLLPAGSISGAPKEETVQIIQEVEAYDRGFYTGIFGQFDGRSFKSAVMIRYIEQSPDGTLTYKSGGGITALSRLDQEYQELIQKVYVPVF